MHWHHTLSVEEYLETTNSDNEIPVEESYDSESTGEEEEYTFPTEMYREEYTPPTETYRQEKCVICLEDPPNILYLDCMHIAVCDSCDRMKSKMSLQSTCDVCRSEISRRIKI